MLASDALILIAEIRKGKISKENEVFVNSIQRYAEQGRTLSQKQGWRLNAIYLWSQGHGAKLWSKVI